MPGSDAPRGDAVPTQEPGVDARALDRQEPGPVASRPAGADGVRGHPANQSEAQSSPNAREDASERPETTEPG
jgi:hypothetical protein